VEAVAAGHDVAFELVACALVREADARPLGLELAQADVIDLEEQRHIAGEPRGDEILHDLRLAVDDDRVPVAQLRQRHVVTLAVELQVDAVVDDALAVHPLADTRFTQQLDSPLLEHAGADSVLDVLTATGFEDHAFDSRNLEQPRERQARGTRADDPDLRPHRGHLR
jgi:hypothetical protein